MPYIALYRKYRSQTFADVVGQEHVTRTLQNAIQRNTIGQAYLFTGSRGTGKTTVARLLAKAVNCEKGPTPDPCNTCALCQSITQGSAVDVTEVDAASNRGVSEMESICEGVRYRPMEARYRVVILDEAHQLSDHAKDAFLKTLEEPPAHALFVLATTEPSKIPITIRSRCQQFDFHRGTPSQVEERLKWVCQQESVDLDPEAGHLIAAHAQGSWRDGLSLLEQVIAFTGQKITVEDTRKVLGTVPEETTQTLLDAILARDSQAVLTEVRRSWEWGVDPRRLLSALVETAREKLEQAFSDGQDSQSLQRLLALIKHLAESEAGLRNWERADLAIEVALLSAAAEPVTSQQPAQAEQPVASPVARPKPARPKQTAPVTPKKEPASKQPEIPSTESPEQPSAATQPIAGELDQSLAERAWPRVIQNLRTDRANTSLCAILKDGWPSSVSDGTVFISFPETHSFHVQRIEQAATRTKVESAFQEVTGLKVQIRATAGEQTSEPSHREDIPDANKPTPPAVTGKTDQNGETTELIQEVLKTFGGEVLDDQDPFTESSR